METSEARGSHCLIFRCSGNTGFVVQTTAYSRTVIQDRRAFIDVLPCHATCLMGKIHNQASMRRVEKWKPQVTELVCFWHFIICPEGEYLPVEITKEWLFNVFGSGCLVDGTVELKRGTQFYIGHKTPSLKYCVHRRIATQCTGISNAIPLFSIIWQDPKTTLMQREGTLSRPIAFWLPWKDPEEALICHQTASESPYYCTKKPNCTGSALVCATREVTVGALIRKTTPHNTCVLSTKYHPLSLCTRIQRK